MSKIDPTLVSPVDYNKFSLQKNRGRSRVVLESSVPKHLWRHWIPNIPTCDGIHSTCQHCSRHALVGQVHRVRCLAVRWWETKMGLVCLKSWKKREFQIHRLFKQMLLHSALGSSTYLPNCLHETIWPKRQLVSMVRMVCKLSALR